MKRSVGLIALIVSFLCLFLMELDCFADNGPSGANESDEGLDGKYYMTGDGQTLQNLGGGQFLGSDGKMVQLEDLGGGEYMTDSGEIVQDRGEGEYMSSEGESMRDMD
ncbi:MAG: hypothetical protein U9R44_06470 [Candidatus Omnitrophota bacterium]|nr:hypothetical protein [Candidatus Omnitrophota bacterium]